MKSICFLGLIFLFGTVLSVNRTEFIKASDNFYVSTQKKSFIGAWINCKTGGMDLASVRTNEEQLELNTLIGASNGDGEGYWLGGVSETINSDWYWTDSSIRIFYQNWGTGQPRYYGGQVQSSCIRLGNFYGASQNHLWQSVPCNYELYFICKYSG